jgi:hypothetical protein
MRKRTHDTDGQSARREDRGGRRLLPEVEASFALSAEELAEVRARLGARAVSARRRVLDQSSHLALPGGLVRVRGRRPAAAGAGRSRIEVKRHRGHTAEEFGLEVESFEKGAALLELLGHPRVFFLQKLREAYVLPCAAGGGRGHAEAASDSYPGLRPYLEMSFRDPGCSPPSSRRPAPRRGRPWRRGPPSRRRPPRRPGPPPQRPGPPRRPGPPPQRPGPPPRRPPPEPALSRP